MNRILKIRRRDGRIVALGVVPSRPETGFGYLELGATIAGTPGLRSVVCFREKPGLEAARSFAASGHHHWNAGMFVFRGDLLLAQARAIDPALVAGVENWAREPERDELYAALPAISIDYPVMEKVAGLVTLPLDCGWDYLGSWDALFYLLPGDADGNRRHGSTVAVDARGYLLFAEQGTIAVLGVEGLVVVRSGDAVLVMPREALRPGLRVALRCPVLLVD